MFLWISDKFALSPAVFGVDTELMLDVDIHYHYGFSDLADERYGKCDNN